MASHNQRYTLTFDAELNIGQMKGALNNIQSALNKLNIPSTATKGLEDTFHKLSEELRNFETLNGKGIKSSGDFKKIETSAEKLITLYERLKVQARDLGKASGKDLEKLFPAGVTENINKATAAMSTYINKVKAAQTEVDKQNKKVREWTAQLNAREQKKASIEQTLNTATANANTAENAIKSKAGIDDIAAAYDKVREMADKAAASAQKYEAAVVAGTATSGQKSVVTRAKNLQALIKEYDNAKAAAKTATTDLEKTEKEIENARRALEKYQALVADALKNQPVAESAALNNLFQDLEKLNGIDLSNYDHTFEGAKKALNDFVQANGSAAIQEINGFIQVLETEGVNCDELRQKMEATRIEDERLQNQMREIGAIKQRIQYFFGLQNTINLVKRAIRSAFNTIKELDKAMTETAVVTDFSVSDMWAQLPEYTKRASELGVTTLEAYQAATLYYQQGLKTNEVNALSIETLKMARIAGLEAADATDRMTNALRGFNMELTEANAQRVDDVYSELAANTASNVDEISTAMTKVASLANNANMEFETTAAFLAQIIETTRESAETAGTALKTVVARFSEVKKLVDENTIRGQDEEGQVIDVNKVSTALRSAGIDLNKYFLGEVGLDDIFIELAEKWDSLTSLQQRYIATQAAGSRQQSRFIALMSDYARTQELVGKAYDANGASARQFEKTQDSLQSKLARLKNEWNEFLMGLTNNVVIKTAVDWLTKLLHGFNSLTSAIGEGTNGLVKWGVELGIVLSTLKLAKGIFKTGGILDAGLGLLTGGTVVGNALEKIGLTTKAGAGAASAAARGGAHLAGATGIAGTTGTVAGTGLMGGLAKMGAKIAGKELAASTAAMAPGMISSLGAIATALGVVAAAVGAVIAAYQLWLHFSLAGQLKQAEQFADIMNKNAKNAKKASEEIKAMSESYESYTEAVQTASNIEERSAAIKERNDYITSLLEQNSAYAQYLKTEIQNGEIILTFDTEKLEEGIKKAEESAEKTQVGADMATAVAAGKQADIYEQQLRSAGIDLEKGTKTTEVETANGKIEKIVQDLTQEEIAKYSAISLKAEAARAEEQNYAQMAYLRNFTTSDLDIDDNLASLFAEGFAQTFSEQQGEDEFLENVNKRRFQNWWNGYATKEELQRQYKELYGTDAGDLKRGELAKLVAEAQVTGEEVGKSENTVAELLASDQVELYKTIADAYQKAGEKTTESLLTLDIENDTELAEYLGLENLVDGFSELEKAIGLDEGALREHMKTQLKLQKQTQQEAVNATAKRMLTAGSYSDEQIIKFELLKDTADQEYINKLLTQVEDFSFGDKIVNSIIDAMAEEDWQDSAFQSWFNNLDLSNPIQASNELNSALESTDERIRQLAEDILNSGNAVAEFSDSAQVQYFLTSESFENLSESLDDFKEKNGEITSSNIKELAKSNKDLNTLLKNNVVTAKGLANILKGLDDGKFTFMDINDAILAAVNSLDDLDGMVSDLIDDLNSFDPGFDEDDITGFINKVYDFSKEKLEKGAYGNNAMGNYMRYIFGDPKEGEKYGEGYINWLNRNLVWLEANKENMYSAWTEIAGSSEEGAKIYGDGVRLWEENGEIFIDTLGHTTEEIVQILTEGSKGTANYTEQQIRMMIGDLKQYSADLAQALSEADLPKAIEAWYEELDEIHGIKIFDEAQVKTLSSVLNVSEQEVWAAIQNLAKDADDLRRIEWDINTDGIIDGQERLKILEDLGAKIRGYYTIAGKEAEERVYLTQHTLGGKYTSTGQYEIINADNLRQELESAGLVEHFSQILNDCIKEGDHFVQTIRGQLTDIEVQAGETAGDALARVTSEVADEALATAISEKLADALTDLKVGLDTTEYDEQSAAVKEDLEVIDNTEVAPTLTANTSQADAAIQTTTSLLDGFAARPNVIEKTIRMRYEVMHTEVTDRAATGGIVPSYASGSHRLHAGFALTGEEGPEIIWNKEQGYSYITGQDGPQFQNLNAGDRVFNAQETARILRNSGLFGSFAGGSHVARGYGGTVKTTVTGSPENPEAEYEKQSTWYNDLDWLYNLMEDIAELERQQNFLQTQHNIYLKDINATGRDLYNTTRSELNNLATQLDNEQVAQLKRLQQMRELFTMFPQYAQYAWWNSSDQTLEINWDAIEAIRDKDTYDEVTELISRAETIQGQIDDAESAMWSIKEQIQELQDRYLQKFLDFQDRILNALVAQYQTTIDNLSTLNDTINDSNNAILNSIQNEIDLARQIRDNTDTEKELSDLEARLAYLQRDTTGANAQEIRQLQEQLDEARQGYSDTLIDQSIDRLAQANDKAAEQREKQIELMQAQLDYLQKSGGLWNEVATLMEGGFAGDGTIIRYSQLEQVLRNAEDWDAMSQAQRDNWANELILETNEVGAHLIQISEGLDSISAGVWASIPAHSYTATKVEEKYATGGLNTYTGLAHLDGTPSAPEYVLNARQTDAFLRLAEVLPTFMGTSTNTISNSYGGDIYLDINMHVDEIGSNYDVDKIAERVKDIIYDASSYRNVNTLNFIR